MSKVRGATAEDLISINCEEVIKGLEQTNIKTKVMAFILRVTHYNRDVVEINRFNLHIIIILKRQNML